MKTETITISRPLSEVNPGDFFYHKNKRYVLLSRITGEMSVEAIHVSGKTVRLKGNPFVKQYEVVN